MALGDFFRINMPYCIEKNSNNEWIVYNREYLPLGWNSADKRGDFGKSEPFSQLPIRTKYKGLTETKLQQIVQDESFITRNEDGKITKIYLYDDDTNPQSDITFWPIYSEKLKKLIKLIQE